jgi:cell division septum initiation protein DivIVA
MRVQEPVRESNEGRGGKTLEEYAVENYQLKLAVDQLSRKVASYKEVTTPISSLFLTI